MERLIEKDIAINRFRLEDESEKQADLYYYWAEKFAEAKSERDKAKDSLKTQEAEIEMKIRQGIVDIGCKITESAIESFIYNYQPVVEKRKLFFQADLLCNKIGACEESMRQKKSQIENLIQLYVKEYYSNPTVKNGSDDASNSVREALNKKK